MVWEHLTSRHLAILPAICSWKCMSVCLVGKWDYRSVCVPGIKVRCPWLYEVREPAG